MVTLNDNKTQTFVSGRVFEFSEFSLATIIYRGQPPQVKIQINKGFGFHDIFSADVFTLFKVAQKFVTAAFLAVKDGQLEKRLFKWNTSNGDLSVILGFDSRIKNIVVQLEYNEIYTSIQLSPVVALKVGKLLSETALVALYHCFPLYKMGNFGNCNQCYGTESCPNFHKLACKEDEE